MTLLRIAILFALVAMPGIALGQPVYGPPLPGSVDAADFGPRTIPDNERQTGNIMPEMDAVLNPVSVLDSVGRSLPGRPEGEAGISAAMSVVLLITVIALAPTIMLMTTCFLRIIVVLGLLRQAMGTAGIPPPQVVTGLALFMTLTVMAPTLERIWEEAVLPYQAGEVTTYEELWERGRQPLRDFMFAQIDATGNWSSLYMVLEYRGVDISEPSLLTRADVKTGELVSAYMLSELKTAFLMGFKVYLPFLVIDMVIASVLISMSMMMLPPVLISLPFKLLLFVLVDGWTLIVGSLMYSFAPGTPASG